MTEKRTVWVAYTNTDCTEGRGHDVPIAVCAAEATARRLAHKQYVQGSDGPVRTMELLKIEGKWYAPSAAINVVDPTREDIAVQAAIDSTVAAERERIKAAVLRSTLFAEDCEGDGPEVDTARKALACSILAAIAGNEAPPPVGTPGSLFGA
jgi:hypothetical protein